MDYRVIDMGYRLVKFGGHVASCALQGLARGGVLASAGALGRSLSGLGNSSGRAAMLAGGAALMMLVGPGGHQPAFAQTTQTLVDGNQAGGFRVSAVIGNVSTVPSAVVYGTPLNA